jgi:hypothetical protein
VGPFQTQHNGPEVYFYWRLLFLLPAGWYFLTL